MIVAGCPAGKRVFGGNHAQNYANHKGCECDKIVVEFPPQQHAKNGPEQGKENDLICAHGPHLTRRRARRMAQYTPHLAP
jgi:hypothetical protein